MVPDPAEPLSEILLTATLTGVVVSSPQPSYELADLLRDAQAVARAAFVLAVPCCHEGRSDFLAVAPAAEKYNSEWKPAPTPW